MKVTISKIKYIFDDFSAIEKALFSLFSFFLILSSCMLFFSVFDSFRKDAPGYGGTLHEGVVGYPSFINPLLSTTNAGRDLSYLTYSGLMRINENGEFVPDLAESFTVSNDGTTYTFILREDTRFHDGKPLTSSDIVFTIKNAKDPKVKSPLATNWAGVKVVATDARTVVFTLNSPYAPFIENTAIGILPEHIWKDADLDQFTFSPYNFEPVGSGPYIVREIKRNTNGTPYLYHLEAWGDYAAGKKNISNIYIHIYPDAEKLLNALRHGEIESAGDLSPTDAETLKKEGFNVRTTDLLRNFGVFFNQNQATLFADKNVRYALEMAVDRNRIIDTVLLSYGNEEDAPLPGSALRPGAMENASSAKALLLKDGWKENNDGILEKKDTKGTVKLSFTVITSNDPELLATANLLKEQWRAIGAEVSIVSLDPAELTQTVIRPRKYDALLFGEVIGRGKDLYPFWYSGERRDPGLNIALYTNSKADSLLQKARTATSSEETAKHLASFTSIFHEDMPAIFLYSPQYLYIVPEKIKGLTLPALDMAHERFAGILSSYINAKRVWK